MFVPQIVMVWSAILAVFICVQAKNDSGSNENQVIISEDCIDPLTNRTYNVGDTWKSNEMCEIYRCDIVQISPFQYTVAAVKQKCANETVQPGCYLAPKVDGIYPFCCAINVCPHKRSIEMKFDRLGMDWNSIKQLRDYPTISKLILAHIVNISTARKRQKMDENNLMSYLNQKIGLE